MVSPESSREEQQGLNEASLLRGLDSFIILKQTLAAEADPLAISSSECLLKREVLQKIKIKNQRL